MIEFGLWLKCHREYLGITPSELAKRARMDRTNVWKLEAGKSYPTILTAQKLCWAMGLEMWEAFFFMEKCDGADYQPEEV